MVDEINGTMPVRRVTTISILILFCFTTHLQANVPEKNREAKLLNLIRTSKDYWVNVRAIREIGRQTLDDRTSLALFTVLVSELEDYKAYELSNVLAKSKSTSVPGFVRIFNERPRSKNQLEKFLFILNRMGTKANKAIPFLLQQIPKYRSSPTTEGLIRVVLAGTGYSSKENIEWIAQHFDRENEMKEVVAETLAQAGQRGWVPEKIVSGLVVSLENLDNLSANVAPVLAGLKVKDNIAVNKLKKLWKIAITDSQYGSFRVPFGLALMSMDERNREGYFAEILKGLSDGMSRTDVSALYRSVVQIDDQVMKLLGEMLNHEDDRTVLGATRVLDTIGYPAPDLAERLKANLKGRSNEEIKIQSAKALSMIGSETDLPFLKFQVEYQKSDKVKGAIWRSINIIELKPGAKD